MGIYWKVLREPYVVHDNVYHRHILQSELRCHLDGTLASDCVRNTSTKTQAAYIMYLGGLRQPIQK